MYYKVNKITQEKKVFFDPNTLSSDGSMRMSSGILAKEGEIFIVRTHFGGSDVNSIQVSQLTIIFQFLINKAIYNLVY